MSRVADEQGATAKLQGTTQNDIIKEYLSRGTYIFPPQAVDAPDHRHHRLHRPTPKWNPMNVCSYHLQEAGATPEQELAFALATACAVLDIGESDRAGAAADFPNVSGSISFFVNAGIRFVTEMCKMRAFVELWDQIGRDPLRRHRYARPPFRYGVQVNSLGLTEQQPENNVYRILLECWPSPCRRNAPRPRRPAARLERGPGPAAPLGPAMVAAPAADPGLRNRPARIRRPLRRLPVVEALKDEARAMLAKLDAMGGGTIDNIDFMKSALVESQRARLKEIEAGRQIVVGVNRYETTEPSPLSGGDGRSWRRITAPKAARSPS
jgi:(2R)-ethylmalonyl-CoA mutase